MKRLTVLFVCMSLILGIWVVQATAMSKDDLEKKVENAISG
jgi:hypothetical protein